MGATQFMTTGYGKTAEEAFANAREQALYDHGHGGYTGTIAEKDDFIMIELPNGWPQYAEDYAERLMEADDPRIEDKWGPAGCIKNGDAFLFFGWAST